MAFTSSKLCASLSVLVVLVLVYQPDTAEAGIGDCWDTWSRCTRWSRIFTGIAWQSCSQRCQCLGKSGGSCVLTPSTCPLSSKAWQCQCSSSPRRGRKPSWCGY